MRCCETAKELWDSLKTRHVGEEKDDSKLWLQIIDDCVYFTSNEGSDRIKLRKGGQVESQENLLFAHGEHSGKGRRFSKRGGRSNFSRGNWQNNRNRNNSQGRNSNHKGNSNKSKAKKVVDEGSKDLRIDIYSIRLQSDIPLYVLYGNIDKSEYGYGMLDLDIEVNYINEFTKYCKEEWNSTKVTHLSTATVMEFSGDERYRTVLFNYGDPITDPNSPITPPNYTYNPHSEEEEEATTSSMENLGNRFDDTPVRGFKNLTEIYENTHEVETENLLLMEEEPRTYKEASTDKKWIEAMKIELDSINKNNT
ncbi:hypothetical protein Tco_1254442 [Tanacetum coccineum]